MFDVDQDGKITWLEFLDTMEGMARIHHYELSKDDIAEAKAEFNSADVDKSGEVDVTELEGALDEIF